MYRCLTKQKFISGNYTIIPLRSEDRYKIMQWRNEQIFHLRQKKLLTPVEQDHYFEDVITNDCKKEIPKQILFSFLKNDDCIGYGGLVHIDWESKNAEISFLTATDRNVDEELFVEDMNTFLALIFLVAFKDLGFHKLHTSVYDVRPLYISTILKMGFINEGRMKEHVMINEKLYDLLVYSIFNNKQLEN